MNRMWCLSKNQMRFHISVTKSSALELCVTESNALYISVAKTNASWIFPSYMAGWRRRRSHESYRKISQNPIHLKFESQNHMRFTFLSEKPMHHEYFLRIWGCEGFINKFNRFSHFYHKTQCIINEKW